MCEFYYYQKLNNWRENWFTCSEILYMNQMVVI